MVLPKWNNLELGFKLEEGSLVQTLLWADNIYIYIYIYILAGSKRMLGEMMDDLTEAFQRARLAWKPGSMSFIQSSACSALESDVHPNNFTYQVAGGGTEVMKEVEAFICLGVKIDARATVKTALDYRLEMAMRHWHARRRELTSKSIHLGARLERWYATVGKTLTWGAECWRLTTTEADSLIAFETRCLRQMLGRKRRPGEGWAMFSSRVARVARELLRYHAIDDLITRLASQYFTWAGHVARISFYPIAVVDRWRSLQEWKALQAAGMVLDGANSQSWRHLKPGRYYHWDQGIHDYIGTDWRVLAADRDAWAERKASFVHSWRYHLAGAKRLYRGSSIVTDPNGELQQPQPNIPFNHAPKWIAPFPPRSSDEVVELVIKGESESVLKQLKGQSKVDAHLSHRVWRQCIDIVEHMDERCNVRWTGSGGGPWERIHRADNKEAKELAGWVLKHQTERYWMEDANQIMRWMYGCTYRIVVVSGTATRNLGQTSAAAIVYYEDYDNNRHAIANLGRLLGTCGDTTADMSAALVALFLVNAVLCQV